MDKEKSLTKKQKKMITILATITAVLLTVIVFCVVFISIKEYTESNKGIYSEVIITKCDDNNYYGQVIAFENDKDKYKEYVDDSDNMKAQEVSFKSDIKFNLGSKISGYYYKGEFLKPYKELD